MTDEEALPLRHKDNRILPGYNNQSAVDGKYGVICGIQTKNSSDHPDDFFPLLAEANRNSGGTFENVLADCGFSSYEIYEEIARREEAARARGEKIETCYIPDERYSAKRDNTYLNGDYDLEHFTKDAHGTYHCPEGHKIEYKGRIKKADKTIDKYQGTRCQDCSVHDACTKQKYRTLQIDSRIIYQEKMRERLDSDKGKRIYQKRQGIVEPVHGDDQKNKGWTQHHLRSLKNASGEFYLIRIATNLGKLVRYAGEKLLQTSR